VRHSVHREAKYQSLFAPHVFSDVDQRGGLDLIGRELATVKDEIAQCFATKP